MEDRPYALDHAMLFSRCVRTRRHAATMCARNPHRFSSMVAKFAFHRELDATTKSWFAFALGRMHRVDCCDDLRGWIQRSDAGDEDAFWGKMSLSLLTSDDHDDAHNRTSSSVQDDQIDGLLRRHAIREKSRQELTAIESLLQAGDPYLSRWGLVAVSGCDNFTRWDLIVELLEKSDDPISREWSAWCLARSPRLHSFTEHIEKALNSEMHPRVREWLYKAYFIAWDRRKSDFALRAFADERDPMILEGIIDSALLRQSTVHNHPLRYWLLTLTENHEELQDDRFRIAFCQGLRLFYQAPMLTEELDLLAGRLEYLPKAAAIAVCAAIRSQLRDLPSAKRTGLLRRLDQIVEQNAQSFDTLHRWDSVVRAHLPAVFCENLAQTTSGAIAENIVQRATAIVPDSRIPLHINQAVIDIDACEEISQEVRINTRTH